MSVPSSIGSALASAALGIGLWAAAIASPAAEPPPGYLRADGAIAIVGNDGLGAVIAGIGAIVARTHPGPTYAPVLKGSSTGLPALAAGATLFAPLAREAWRGEVAGFRQIHGYDPTPIRIGSSGWGPRATGKTPPAVYVSKANPIAALSVADLGRVFTAGSLLGDINLWSQLGVKGEAGGRRIHIYGLRDDGGFATAFRDRHFGARPYAPRYEPLDGYAAVLRAVAADPYGIGIVGWVDAAPVGDGVRVLPIAAEGRPPALPSREVVAAGLYPLSSSLAFYVDRAPGKPLPPLVRAWLDAALSDEGQAVIAAEADAEDGYLPLSAADLAAERANVAAL